MQVLKFGGSSVANAANMSKVVEIVSSATERDRTILVCSAIGGCTDALIETGRMAASGNEMYSATIDSLERRHSEIIDELIPAALRPSLKEECKFLFASLRGIAHGVFLVRELSEASLSAIESFGELLSTKIIATRFKSDGIPAVWVDSREIIRVENGVVDTKFTYGAINALVDSAPSATLFILPGFIANDENGRTTTLGRGGSDYTASLFAAGTQASRLEIWTDVPGMMTTNPRIVPGAKTIRHISYRAALELSHFGAKVIYPPTIHPVVAHNIPIYIKNTFDPEAEGTCIEANPPQQESTTSMGISNSDDIALISLEGSGMVGVPGFSSRLFDALSRSGVSIILITQASSVNTMCVAISEKDAKLAKKAADECFAYEISLGTVNPLKVETGYSIVCLVGDNMMAQCGLSGRMLAALGRNGILIRATAQGSSERNISVIVKSDIVNEALAAIHSEFFDRTGERTVNLYISGFGTIGSALVRMISENAESIARRTGKRLRVCGLATKDTYVIDRSGIDVGRAAQLLEKGSDASDGEYLKLFAENPGRNAVFVDCTASTFVCSKYKYMLERGLSVVACNKLFFSGDDYDAYCDVKAAAVREKKSIRYETTVEAAMPVLETISRCVNSGDRLVKVEAVLSGTLNYLCSQYEGGDFDALVREARRMGYTEPNPAEDLSGRDVMRKLVIICREAGMAVSAKDVALEPFPVEDIKARYEMATARGLKLRYIARLENGKASVGLREVGPDNPLYCLKGTDNAAVITTADYPSPQVIQGAGAGGRQTAGGLLNDILSI